MGDAERLLAGLNPAQRRALVTESAPLCILAGAGSGKTRVLTRRIAFRVEEGTADARHVLALTFTRKAAGELRSRLTSLGVRDQLAAGTFHAIAYAQLRRRWADHGERPPALLERKVRLLAPLLPRRRDATVQPADLATEIEWAKARLVSPRRYEEEAARAGRRPPLPAAAMGSIYARYEEEKRHRGLVDFDDLLLLCARAIETDREFGAAQRWRFRHVFVDEFQDVNPLQHRLLDAWRGDRLDVCVVGDPNQAIYGWNGADASFLVDLGRRFPGTEVVHLDVNYRSSPEIVTVANAVLGSRRDGRALKSARPEGAIPTVSSHSRDRDEAAAVARTIRRRHGATTRWRDCAVLARTNAQLALFEEALRSARVPYRVRGGGGFLDQPEIRQALADLRRSATGTPFALVASDLAELAAERDGEPAGRDDPDAVDNRRRNLQTLAALAADYAGLDPQGSTDGFLGWLAASVRSDGPDGGDAVELATFHAAKGLEWPVVFVTGLEQGLVPIGHATTADARAEERRLLYVALTRAEHELHCSWAERRTFGSRTMSRTSSPHLAAVEAAVEALTTGEPLGDIRRKLEEPRRKLKTASAKSRAHLLGSNADPQVLDALKSWRKTAARASGVPAFVIMHDTTLAAVAESRPRDRASLLAVPGMGPVKIDRYGDQLLAVVAAHAAS